MSQEAVLKILSSNKNKWWNFKEILKAHHKFYKIGKSGLTHNLIEIRKYKLAHFRTITKITNTGNTNYNRLQPIKSYQYRYKNDRWRWYFFLVIDNNVISLFGVKGKGCYMMSWITLEWVDKLRDLINAGLPDKDIVNQMLEYGNEEEASLNKRIIKDYKEIEEVCKGWSVENE